MANADDFRRLTDEMVTSYKERIAWLSSLLEGFKKEDKERARGTSKLLEDFKKEDKERATSVATMLESFRKEQTEVVAAWRELMITMKTAKETTNGYGSN